MTDRQKFSRRRVVLAGQARRTVYTESRTLDKASSTNYDRNVFTRAMPRGMSNSKQKETCQHWS